MANVFSNAAELFAAQGKDLGTTDWIEMSQRRIDQFADATGDHQWIHVDPEKAKSGPFGVCIGVNVGCDRVRFPAPVKAGTRIRGRGEMLKVEQLGQAVQTTVRVTVEIEGGERPGCVVDTISRYTFA